MTMIDSTHPTGHPSAVPHPVWCRSGHTEGAPYLGDKTSKYYADTMAPAEADFLHLGRAYRVDTGEHYSGSVEVSVGQYFDGERLEDYDPSPAVVNLIVRNEDFVDAEVDISLRLEDIDRVIEVLTKAKADLLLGERHRSAG